LKKIRKTAQKAENLALIVLVGLFRLLMISLADAELRALKKEVHGSVRNPFDSMLPVEGILICPEN